MVELDKYEDICNEIDESVGYESFFAGTLAEAIAKHKLTGELRKEVIRFYAKQCGVGIRELTQMVKDME